jgi:hypothetical protein
VKINKSSLTQKEICVFISGYQSTHITRFLGTHPALLVADHVDKVSSETSLFSSIDWLIVDRFFTSSRCPWTQRQSGTQQSAARW